MSIDRGFGIGISNELADSYNVKDFADDAEAAKLAAQAAQAAAETAETNAETAESNASASASASATSATAASQSATSAATSASNALTSQNSAQTYASNASISESNASSSATSAASSATAAASSATSASTSATNAAASYDSFIDRYLGEKSSDPTTDNSGDPLITGALYFNTTDNGMKVYSGSAWLDAYVPSSDYLALTGGTMTGKITLDGNPSSALHAATKEYVDTIAAAGIHYHTPVRVEAPSNLNATYDNGTSGVGATLTNAGTNEAIIIDGVTLSSADRVLVYNQTNAAHNGIYTVTTVGDGSTAWVLTRATDADSYGASDPDSFGEGDAFFVKEGDTGAGELYVMNTSGTITFGTTDITFTVIAETAVYTGGTGITLTGTTFDIDESVVVNQTSATGSVELPTGTTAERDGSPSAGYLRWNTTEGSAEVYDGSDWGSVGGGGAATTVYAEHANTLSENLEIASGNNAVSGGPITINTGYSVTVPSGSVWTIV